MNTDHSLRNVSQIPIAQVHPSPTNPRGDLGAEGLAELADSIQTHGILQPLTARRRPDGEVELIAGHRRLAAAQVAGLDTVPVIVLDDVDDAKARQLQLLENVQREDLAPLELARGLQALRDGGMTVTQIAASIGKAQPTVSNLLRLLQLPAAAAERLTAGELTAAHGVALAKWADYPELAARIAQVAVENHWTVPQTEGALSAHWYLRDVVLQVWNDCPDGPTCPHFRAVAGGLCLNPKCHQQKLDARDKARAEKAITAYQTAHPGAEPPTTLYDNYKHRSLAYTTPPKCLPDCPKRLDVLDKGTGAPIPVCTDLKCYDRLSNASQRAQAQRTKDLQREALQGLATELCSRDVDGADVVIIAAHVLTGYPTQRVRGALKACGWIDKAKTIDSGDYNSSHRLHVALAEVPHQVLLRTLVYLHLTHETEDAANGGHPLQLQWWKEQHHPELRPAGEPQPSGPEPTDEDSAEADEEDAEG